jgi:hypothetical protein
VAVENSLPANVDLFSFEYIGASHPVELMYYDFDRKMRFQFNNILLPDSNTNETLSHGFIRYRINPSSSLIVGDSVLNAAAIFFDLNAPGDHQHGHHHGHNDDKRDTAAGLNFSMLAMPWSAMGMLAMFTTRSPFCTRASCVSGCA